MARYAAGNTPRHVVGIGASAGGLESLEQLFQHMPVDTDMAFVVIQHLSPDFRSMMNELLARDTTMRIVVAEDNMSVESNVIYLMPPKKEMIIADGRLHLSDKPSTRGPALPIDHFLQSLAREYGKFAIAIILSGSGTDGTRGVADIARRGGLVISESLDTAKFDGMPSSAQATGLVHLTLPPHEMGKALVAYRDAPDRHPAESHADELESDRPQGMDAIFQLFRQAYDIDFTSYKDTTVLRRIRRRLAMSGRSSLDDYAAELRGNPTELHVLYGDLLIGVTQFFRDRKVFQRLCDDVLPEVVRKCERNEGVRAWVAGCATGEEAYSVAIAFQEAMRKIGRTVPLKMFATDVHKRSIEQAGRGYFNQDSLAELPPDLLTRYFQNRTDGYQVVPELRQMIVFAPHNILRDAPFTDLDFVSCRNLLIYLRPTAQRRAISLFHYALRVGGVLLLGASETPGELSDEFEALSAKDHLYRKARDARLAPNLRSPLTSADSLQSTSRSLVVPYMGAVASRKKQIHEQVLSHFMPPSILIDSSRHLIDTFGGAERLLQLPAGQPSLDVLDLVDRTIRTTVAGAIVRSINDQTTVRFDRLEFASPDGNKLVDFSVQPVTVRGDATYYLLTFRPTASPDTIPPSESAERLSDRELDESRDQIQRLEDDLRYSRENLQATIEELETSNEELQATNEELIASNEELQSTNEELHSLNEELYSVNCEHQRKIEELAELNRDMNLLLENTDVATVFLDLDLRIRRFTSRAKEVFDLIPEDVGRPIHAFAAKLPLTDLTQRLREVLTSGTLFEQEIRNDEQNVYLMRLLPYRTNDVVSGAVMMWIDLSSLEQLRGRLRWLSAIVESTSDAIIGHDLQGMVTSWNRGAELLYGYTPEEAYGNSIDMIVPPERLHELTEYRERIRRGEKILSVDTVRVHRDGRPIHVSLTVSPVLDSYGNVIGISKIARDISSRIQLEQTIRNQVTQRERFLAMLSHELRNPFHAIRSAALVVSDDRATLDHRAAAAITINRQVEIVNHLLMDLLDTVRIAENRITLKLETFDLRDLIQPVLEIIEPEMQLRECRVDYTLADTPVLVHADRTRLIQVQVNLLHNAAKHSGATSPIRCSVQRDASRAHFFVTDQGRGIPEDMLEKIFEPFTQLDRSDHPTDGGLGVGLALAKTLVELHGGEIEAMSPGVNQGSTFHFWLPLAATENTKASEDDDGDPAAHGDEEEPEAPLRPLRICIVEDIQDSREMIKLLLELDGHEVSSAGDGRTAIELIERDRPDLAIVDIGLPDIAGYEVAHTLRERGTKPRRLVALTGYGKTTEVQKAFDSGFDDHMVKPLDPKRLQQLIDHVTRTTS